MSHNSIREAREKCQVLISYTYYIVHTLLRVCYGPYCLYIILCLGSEECVVELVASDQLRELVRSGAITHALVVAAFYLYEAAGT